MRRAPHTIAMTAVALGLLASACAGESNTDDAADATSTSASAGASATSAAGSETSPASPASATPVDDVPATELPAAPGFDPDAGVFTVGVLTPQTGPVAQAAANVLAGNQVGDFDRQRRRRHRRPLPSRARHPGQPVRPAGRAPAYNGMKDNVAVLTHVLGTAIVNTLLPELAREAARPTGVQKDAAWVPEQNLIPIGATYQTLMINGVSYVAEQMDNSDSVFCSLIQDDAVGEANQEGVEAPPSTSD